LVADMIAYNWLLHEPYVAKYTVTEKDLDSMNFMDRHM
jgi:hypothetical protein